MLEETKCESSVGIAIRCFHDYGCRGLSTLHWQRENESCRGTTYDIQSTCVSHARHRKEEGYPKIRLLLQNCNFAMGNMSVYATMLRATQFTLTR